MPSPPPPPRPTFKLFVSCVDGRPVTRFAADGRAVGIFGARRADQGRAYVYDEQAIFAIGEAEYEAHGAEYERAVRERLLRQRTAEEWRRYVAAQKAAQQATLEAQKNPPTQAPAEGAQTEPAAPAGGNPS